MSAKRIIAAGSVLLWVLFISVSSVSRLAAQVPKSEKEIPVFPGAVRDTDKESALKSEQGGEISPNVRSGVLKVYKTSASPEEVFRFYLQKIGAKEGAPDIDPRGLERGAISPVVHRIDYYTDEDFDDANYEPEGCFSGSGLTQHTGTWMKQSLMKNRKPRAPGKWIEAGWISWYQKESNNDLTTFYINIMDESLVLAPKKYATATSIRITATTEKSEEAVREETEVQMDKEVEERAKSLKSKPPTAKDLGAPVYPGAKFNADASAGMSAGNDYAMYLYLTTDPPSKVAAFYGQKLKIKPAAQGGRYMIPLKGKLPMPDEGIVIEPNTMFGGSAKTVITIQKMTGKREE
ncbi:hypothetical protein HY768_02930 [candidate division TA06 bacterium]|uniref:Uncharacterized protein n=1 Tax=candidate division TA06 bacterium TaxID=2250710 RepID=A0A933MKA8_UNCT6|nr:hypothetical protein [candidate division TA06 bacterium]